MSATASYQVCNRKTVKARGAVIRVGGGGATAGEAGTSYWLTIAEAQQLMYELATAIEKAKAAQSSPTPPRGPDAAAAALEAA